MLGSDISHYENFPVASMCVPKCIRPDVVAIYHFARTADDIADEGDDIAAVRKEKLQDLEVQLAAIYRLKDSKTAPQVLPPAMLPLLIETPMMQHLAKTINRHNLDKQHFSDLLSAFTQDIDKTRYATREELLDYCQRSAAPVGRLMLALMNIKGAAVEIESDAICRGLQCINFWQDVAIDWQKGRVYLPQADLLRFNVSEEDIANQRLSDSWRNLMQYQVRTTRALMRQGVPLVARLPGRMRLEIAFTIAGGLRILERIEYVNYDVFNHRPQLNWRDFPVLLKESLRLL